MQKNLSFGQFSLEISSNGMEVLMNLYPPQGDRVWSGKEEIIRALQNSGIVYGINETVIAEWVEQHNQKQVIIAVGKKPIPGKDAEFLFYFETGVFRKAALEDGYGKVDLAQVKVIQSVNPGQVIAEKIPAGPGEPGSDVYGRTLTAPFGKDKNLVLGPNVFSGSPDPNKIIALVEGEPVVTHDQLAVFPVRVIQSDVNQDTGNVEFDGNIVIYGNVEIDMKVVATGEITIYGSVDAAEIRCGGHLFIRGGVYGRGKATVDCTGDCSAKFLDSVTINCQGHITVREYIMNCQINADGKVVVEGGKGQIVGGLIRSGEEIMAKVIGSRLGVQTQLEVGTPPRLKMIYQEVENNLRENQISLDKADKAITMLRQIPKLPEDRQAMLDSLVNTAEVLKQRIAEAEVKKEELGAEILKSTLEKGKIKVSEIINPGVTVTMGRTTIKINEDIRFATLAYRDREIRVCPYF